jgi:hypothetical protein
MWNSSKPDFRCHWRRKRLCGAKNVFGSLRWLKAGDTFNAESDEPSERATIEALNGSLKLFVLVVPKNPK